MNWASRVFNALMAVSLVVFALVAQARAEEMPPAASQSAADMLGPPVHVSVDEKGVAAAGYDVVAFFTQGAGVAGKPEFSAEFDGATYLFSSEETRSMFTTDPGSFTPQYGGFAAYAILAGRKVRVGAEGAWLVEGEKLYFFLSEGTKQLWLKAPVESDAMAGDIWAQIRGLPDKLLIKRAGAETP